MFHDSLNNATKPLKQNAHFSFFLFYNIINYDWTRQKIKEKHFTKRYPKKRQENTAQAHISLLSQIEQ